tara:strand:- start:666 stop:839 length:174 start_codon:yes stop_codon:yes gene_type:complete
MKIGSMRAFLISALVIIILYVLGLFLPILLTSKKSTKLYNSTQVELVYTFGKKIIFL